MIEVTSPQGASLAFLSLATVTFICALCIRCRKKSRILQENNELYIPQVFHREGSRFAVTRSKTVTRTNQIKTHSCQSSGNSSHASNSQQPSASQHPGGSYQNFTPSSSASMEPTYVDPISTPPNGNGALNDDENQYANVLKTENTDHDSDSYDYENAEFLHKIKDDDNDEPDYVNTSTTDS